MVYCTKCGTLNADDATVCAKCGAPLHGGKEESSPYWRHRHMRHEEDYRYWRRRGALTSLIFGVVIILIGLSLLLEQVYGVDIPWWSLIIILLGVYLVLRGIMRSRRYRQ
jgi:uncharacterized membrane protein YvbJ